MGAFHPRVGPHIHKHDPCLYKRTRIRPFLCDQICTTGSKHLRQGEHPFKIQSRLAYKRRVTCGSRGCDKKDILGHKTTLGAPVFCCSRAVEYTGNHLFPVWDATYRAEVQVIISKWNASGHHRDTWKQQQWAFQSVMIRSLSVTSFESVISGYKRNQTRKYTDNWGSTAMWELNLSSVQRGAL